MRDRYISYCAIIISIVAIGYAAWVHHHSNTLAVRAVAEREARLINYLAPRLRQVYTGFGMPENSIPTAPKTIEELFEPLETGMRGILGQPNGTNTVE